MTGYKELMEQAAALTKQAEELRKSELAAVIGDIKSKMQAHGITGEDLGFETPKTKRPRKLKAVVNNTPAPNTPAAGAIAANAGTVAETESLAA